eukprot:2046647-Pleurochrysis_carterae.AAC.1
MCQALCSKNCPHGVGNYTGNAVAHGIFGLIADMAFVGNVNFTASGILELMQLSVDLFNVTTLPYSPAIEATHCADAVEETYQRYVLNDNLRNRELLRTT